VTAARSTFLVCGPEVGRVWNTMLKWLQNLLSWLWNFINQPIFANSAAVVLVALFGFAVTNYYQCKTQSLSDEFTINDLLSEIIERHSNLSDAIHSNLVQKERFFKIQKALNPDDTFVFSENKGKSEWQLRQELDHIVRKWRILAPGPDKTYGNAQQVAGNNLKNCDIVEIEINPNRFRYCETIYYEEFIRPPGVGSVDFRQWLDNANEAGNDAEKQAAFLDYIADKDRLLLTYRDKTGLPNDVARTLIAMWNASTNGRFFPERMCVGRAFSP